MMADKDMAVRAVATCWLGMAMHRGNQRRVKSALRILLTLPWAVGCRS